MHCRARRDVSPNRVFARSEIPRVDRVVSTSLARQHSSLIQWICCLLIRRGSAPITDVDKKLRKCDRARPYGSLM